MDSSESKKIHNGYVSINRVMKESYRIPTYQRGYRWSSMDVEKLLNDIYEKRIVSIEILNNSRNYGKIWEKVFVLDNMGEIKHDQSDNLICSNPYCIQPLVVCQKSESDFENEKEWDVIDGQQRLTTITIIVSALKILTKNLKENAEKPNIINESLRPCLSYQARPSSKKALCDLFDIGEIKNAQEDKLNIDFLYMQNAFSTAYRFFEERICGLNNNVVEYLEYLRDILLHNTKFIWYNVTSNNTNPHDVFANFNSGKIELTNAELVKAVFMDPANYQDESTNKINIKDKQIVMAEKWDEIENELHRPDFWAFVPHPDQYGILGLKSGIFNTRIDIIFEFFIMENWFKKNINKSFSDYKSYREKNESDKYIFDGIEAWVMEQLESQRSEKDVIMSLCWTEIRKIYMNLRELYMPDTIGTHKNRIYNLTGLYINLKNRKDNSVDSYSTDKLIFLDIYHKLANVLKFPRKDRENELLKMIIGETVIFEEINVKGLQENKKDSKKQFKQEIASCIKRTLYKGKNENEIVKLLLIYNIALLNNSDGIGERFNFLGQAKNKWQREHIFASNMNELKMKETEETINQMEKIDIDVERRAALNIIAGESYFKYIDYLFENKNINVSNSYGQTNTAVFDIENEEHLKIISQTPSYEGFTFIEVLRRATRAKKEAEKLLSAYEVIDMLNEISNINSKSKDEIRHRYYYLINEIGENLNTADFLDINNSGDWKNARALYFALKNGIQINEHKDVLRLENNKWTAKICGFEVSTQKKDDDDETYDNLTNMINVNLRSQIGYLIFSNDNRDESENFGKNEKKVHKEIKEFNDFDEEAWIRIKQIMLLCQDTLINRVNKFFMNDFTKLLLDDSMGNMTLLTGGNSNENGIKGKVSNQNQKVSNKPYKKKKEIIISAYKEGDFVPLGSIFVFTDMYNNTANTANFWLPDSRYRYLVSLIETIQRFLCAEGGE